MVELARTSTSSDGGFEVFFRDKYVQLTRFLIFKGASTSDAADIAQNAFMMAYHHWHKIDSPWPWILRVAIRDFARNNQSRRMLETPVGVTGEDIQTQGMPSHENDVINTQFLLDALNTLPSRQKDIALLRFIVDLSIDEIASICQVKESTVRVQLTRIRRRLQQALAAKD
jgi:RNA polymerase sigma-70 factor, ECF subfamily